MSWSSRLVSSMPWAKSRPQEPTYALDPDAVLEKGTRIDNFEILGVLGRGGFGVTYLAREFARAADGASRANDVFSREVAIKEFFPQGIAARNGDFSVIPKQANDAKNAFEVALKLFLREAQAISSVSHPNVIQILSVFESRGTAYFVMPYIKGTSLQAKLRTQKRLNEDEVNRQVIPVLEGLEEAHQTGIIHRDIKPDNIMLREGSERPVLIDFGAARIDAADEAREYTRMDSIACYTPRYAPIEQYARAASDNRHGPFTDVYAFSAVLYACVTGKAPKESTLRSLDIQSGRPDPMVPAKLAAGGQYSPDLLAAIDWGLEIVSHNRPQTVSDLRNAIIGRLAIPDPKHYTPNITAGSAGASGEQPGGAATQLDGPTELGTHPFTDIDIDFELDDGEPHGTHIDEDATRIEPSRAPSGIPENRTAAPAPDTSQSKSPDIEGLDETADNKPPNTAGAVKQEASATSPPISAPQRREERSAEFPSGSPAIDTGNSISDSEPQDRIDDSAEDDETVVNPKSGLSSNPSRAPANAKQAQRSTDLSVPVPSGTPSPNVDDSAAEPGETALSSGLPASSRPGGTVAGSTPPSEPGVSIDESENDDETIINPNSGLSSNPSRAPGNSGIQLKTAAEQGGFSRPRLSRQPGYPPSGAPNNNLRGQAAPPANSARPVPIVEDDDETVVRSGPGTARAPSVAPIQARTPAPSTSAARSGPNKKLLTVLMIAVIGLAAVVGWFLSRPPSSSVPEAATPTSESLAPAKERQLPESDNSRQQELDRIRAAEEAAAKRRREEARKKAEAEVKAREAEEKAQDAKQQEAADKAAADKAAADKAAADKAAADQAARDAEKAAAARRFEAEQRKARQDEAARQAAEAERQRKAKEQRDAQARKDALQRSLEQEQAEKAEAERQAREAARKKAAAAARAKEQRDAARRAEAERERQAAAEAERIRAEQRAQEEAAARERARIAEEERVAQERARIAELKRKEEEEAKEKAKKSRLRNSVGF